MRKLAFLALILMISTSNADLFLDTFSNESYSNQDGDQFWSSDWLETGDDNSPSPPFFNDVGILAGSLILSGSNNDIERRLNLSGYTSAILTFDYDEFGFDSNVDRVDIYVSSGSSWVRIGRLQGSFLNSGSFSFDISAYISSNTGIRFSTSNGLGATDYLFIDNVAVTATPNKVLQHISISHDGSGVSCVAENITFTIHNSTHQVLTGYTGVVTASARIATSGATSGTWVLASAANPTSFVDNGDGTFNYTMVAADNGSFTMKYSFKQDGVINFDVASGLLTEATTEDPDLIVEATFLSEGNFRDEFSEIGSNYRDRFDTVSYDNNDGNLNWASNWIETDRISGGSPSAGDVRITGGRLELTGNNTTFPNLIKSAAQREVDLSSATTATLRFTMRTTSVESNDIASVAVSSNGGASWTTLGTYNDDIDSFQPFSFDITPYISSNTRIRFRIEDQSGSTCCFGPADEILQIEDIQIIINGSGSYGNNDGSLAFSNDWVESDGTGPANGPVSMYYDALYLYGSSSQVTTMSRSMDLSNYDDAQLSFDYEAIGSVDAEDEVRAEVNSGSGWVVLQTITGNVSGSSSLNLKNYLSSNTQIRFVIDDPGTGGDCCYNNNQEVFKIDNVDIEVFQISSCQGADHFSIAHSGNGVNCEAEVITVTAKDSAGNIITDYEGTIDLTTSTSHGDWTLLSGVGSFTPLGSNLGSAEYVFSTSDNGQVNFNFANTYVETLSINILDDQGISETSNNATASDDPDLSFARSGFKFIYGTGSAPASEVIPVQISGRNFNNTLGYDPLKIRAITTDVDTGVCTGLFTGNQTIELALECINPSSCHVSSASQFSINGTNLNKNNQNTVTSYTPITLNFASNSTADLSNSLYSDAGRIGLHARRIQAGDNILGSSNQMEFSPAGFCTTTTDPDYACSGPNYWNCSKFKKAGENFNLTVSAQGWRANADSNFCDNNFILPNFNHGVSITQNLISPVAGNLGAISFNTVNLSSGTASQSVNWSEVGVINFTAGGNNYLSHTLVSTPSHEFGRFFPADFVVNNINNGSYGDANTGFSYIGELDASNTGGIKYGVQPQFDFIVRNVQGDTLKNYLVGSFNKTPLPVINTTSNILGLDGINDLTITTGFNGPTSSYDAATGIYRVSLNSSDHFRYDHTANALVAPFTNDIQINITDYVDSDGVSLSSGVSLNPIGGNVRLGRLRLANAYGSESTSLTHVWSTEYYDGANFILNTDDNGTTYDIAGIGALTVTDIGDPSDPYQITDSTASGEIADTGLFVSGATSVVWSAPVAGRYGKFTFPYASPSWLQFDWNGLGFENPEAEISFGQYRGHDKIIYWKEVYYK
ncbi:DUF6701 domain-containing protein [Bermanella sp. WJH001]|uniref:DUF6701 domain-containing protein n=1 Tax=Bermanella sp. WJH001 TaxID=3048005 RepID=UPI0024BECD5A|nr:DUF6701 domain-containing protein [Bermanella sp. WJH001]MDJ1538686.1 hypothetical protein [Bermanella sp. WJH001]